MDGKELLVFEPGAVLFHQGDPGDYMLLILEGRLDVEVATPGDVGNAEKVTVVATLGPQDLLGELALFLPDSRRTATIRAKTQVVVQKMTYGRFQHSMAQLHERDPVLHDSILAIARKLADTTQRFAAK